MIHPLKGHPFSFYSIYSHIRFISCIPLHAILSTIYRLLPYMLKPFWPGMLDIIKGISPSIAEKVVQVLDIVNGN